MFQLIDTVHAPDRKKWMQACDYRLITSIQQLWDYVGPSIETKKPVGADTETNSLAVYHPRENFRIAGYNLSTSPGSGVYIPVGHLVGYEKNLPHERVLDVLKAIDAVCETFWYNYKFDGEAILRCTGWEPRKWQDVMFMVWMFDPNQKRFGLKDVVRRIFGFEMLKYADVTSGKVVTFDQLDPTEAVNYAGADADFPLRLAALQGVQEALRRSSQVYVLERAFLPVLRRALRTGTYLDGQRLQDLRAYLGDDTTGLLAEAKQAVFAVLGREINLRSQPQVSQALIEAGVNITEKTKGGGVATGKEVLERYVNDHPFVASIVKYRELITARDNYVNKLIAGHEAFGSHVWFPFNQIGAPTGRMSSGGEGDVEESIEKGYINVNVQSTPDPEKKPYLPDIRSAVVAADPATPDADQWAVVSIDYEQIEARLAANLSREPAWIQAFKDGIDIHARNAQLAYRDPTIDKDSPKRKKGKTMLFALLFGATDETVAEHGGIGVKEASELLSNFWAAAGTLAKWVESTHARCDIEKTVTTWLGRVRPLHAFYTSGPGAYSMREEAHRLSVNGQIQGGAADIFKLAAVRVDNMLTRNQWHDACQVMLFMHDELVFRMRKDMVRIIVPAIREQMETIQIKDWPVPFTTDAKFGPNWSEKSGLTSFDKWLNGGAPTEPVPSSPAPAPVAQPVRPSRPAPPSLPPPPPTPAR